MRKRSPGTPVKSLPTAPVKKEAESLKDEKHSDAHYEKDAFYGRILPIRMLWKYPVLSAILCSKTDRLSPAEHAGVPAEEGGMIYGI